MNAEVGNAEGTTVDPCLQHGREELVGEARAQAAVVDKGIGVVLLAHHGVVGDWEDGGGALLPRDGELGDKPAETREGIEQQGLHSTPGISRISMQ